jgi:large subunit ribosomal protein L25
VAGIVLEVEVREHMGTGGARAVRNTENVPGILYGGPRGPVAIQMDRKNLIKALKSGKFISHMVTLRHKGEDQPVIPREIQYHPVTDVPIHFDLYRVEENSIIEVEVPVKVINQDQSPGLKRGGVLNIVDHVLSMKVPAGRIPEAIIIDVAGLEIGAVIHVSNLSIPDGCKVVEKGKDPTVVTISGRMAEEAAPAADSAAGGAAS